MTHTPILSGTVLIHFEDRRGNACDCEVNVNYTFDGNDLRIVSSELLGPADIGSWELNKLIWEAAFDHALDNYPECVADVDAVAATPLHEQIAEARKAMGDERWVHLNSIWEAAHA